MLQWVIPKPHLWDMYFSSNWEEVKFKTTSQLLFSPDPNKGLQNNSKVSVGQGDMENESNGQGRHALEQQMCIITTDKNRCVSHVDTFVDVIAPSLSSLPHLSCSTPTKISNETMRDQISCSSIHWTSEPKVKYLTSTLVNCYFSSGWI